MVRLLFLALLTCSFIAKSVEDEGMKAFNAAILNAKLAGACGVFKQMADFQEVTQMAGGDEFINRFGATEVARLGMTLPQFTNLCTDAINNYNTMNRMSKTE